MDSLKRVIKVGKSTPESLNLRRIFGPCGEIRALHASGFIEFADAASAKRAIALKLDLAGVNVLEVASQPRLVDQYRVVNPSAFAEGDDMQSNAGTGLLLHALKSSFTPVSHRSGPQADSVEIQPTCSNVPLLPPAPSVAFPSSSVSSSSPAATPSPCIDNCIIMRLCGENITLDLRSVGGNPATIIELLKATSSERANWLIVGAYYRRTGNPVGARAVVTAMFEAMKQFNIPENDLKPAFLLLSGCETDLGKVARLKGDTDKASEHYSNAQKWLHMVYGASAPPLSSDTPSADDSKRIKATTPPRAPASLRSRIDTSAPSAPRSHPPSPNHRILEREIQSLRDRHTNNANVIADMRASKRKLEDVVDIERVARRRLERELDDVMKERDNARRLETLALAQMKREVDSRRRAEDMAEGERALRKRAEASADFALSHRTPSYGMPRMLPMTASESFSAFEPHHRISF
ncbi:hypothetical protein C8R47DRAFT_275833 [Mycena vitilis]|nr:hypothetical protein C8R47DRAFT_275833 [Mycena vitilis]